MTLRKRISEIPMTLIINSNELNRRITILKSHYLVNDLTYAKTSLRIQPQKLRFQTVLSPRREILETLIEVVARSCFADGKRAVLHEIFASDIESVKVTIRYFFQNSWLVLEI